MSLETRHTPSMPSGLVAISVSRNQSNSGCLLPSRSANANCSINKHGVVMDGSLNETGFADTNP